MDYKYRSLLMNVPVRHLINRMKMGDAEIEKHLKRLSDVDLNNIFLFSSLENAKTYLDVANMIKMYGTKYSWFVLTKVSAILSPRQSTPVLVRRFIIHW